VGALFPESEEPQFAAPPVQFFSAHNYVSSTNDPDTWQARYFTDPIGTNGSFSALAFIDQLRELMKIRDELSPKTKIVIDELGTFDQIRPIDVEAGRRTI